MQAYLCDMISHRHFALYKPYGYLSQFVYELKRKKKLLGELYAFPENTMAIGRLDEDSEGLLLLTTDGLVSELVRSSKTEKQYFVQVDGIITPEAVAQLQQGVLIGIHGQKYLTKPCSAYIPETIPEFPGRAKKIRDDRHGPTSWYSITIREGKFRQVRKMSAAVGFPVLRLIRVRIGYISLGDMSPGDVIELDNLTLQKP